MWSRNPRLIRDCAAIEEPPNVVTGPLPAHVSCPFLQGLARQGSAGCTSLWLVYISMYVKIVLLFSVHMTLERTKSLRDCHLWGRDWFAIDRRLYPSQEPLFWSTPTCSKVFGFLNQIFSSIPAKCAHHSKKGRKLRFLVPSNRGLLNCSTPFNKWFKYWFTSASGLDHGYVILEQSR